jgi:cytochrome c peroxidase
MNRFVYLISILLLFFTSGCIKTENNLFNIELPSHFPQKIQSFDNKSITKEGFYLGRKLFYDGILSRDSTISCGSCHQQGGAFSHIGHDVSHGIEDKLGTRNANPIQNLLWQSNCFWDGGVHNIELISLAPIDNPVEMDENISHIITKLKRHKEYPTLFKNAFGTDEINSVKILNAVAQFQATLISANSKYDQYLKGTSTLSSEELDGFNLFKEKCSSCHQGVLFSDFQFRNNGLSSNNNADMGRYNITLNEEDKGKFKTPSLRNIEKSGPYMHNGVFRTLEAVLEHYNSGIQPNPSLAPSLKNKIPMTAEEQRKIIIFLKTLTDNEFLSKKDFAEQ